MLLCIFYYTLLHIFLVETESTAHFINDFLAYLVDSYGAYGFQIHIFNLHSLHILFKSMLYQFAILNTYVLYINCVSKHV